MNVCMLTDKPLPSERPTGIGVAAFNMATALSKRGNEIHYLCRGEAERTFEVNDRLKVHMIRHYSRDNLGASLSIMKNEGCEVYHVHSSSAAPSLIVARALGRPAILHSHGDQPLRPLRLTLIRQFEMRLSQRVVAVSRSTRRDLIRNHHLPSEKVVVAYNGVDTDEFRPFRSRTSVLPRYGLGGYERILLSVGALQPRKGQLTMVECLPEILKTWPRLVYVNVGTGYDEGFRDRILNKAKDLGVSGSVMLLPSVPREDLVSLINAADLCVHPSTREPFGLAVVEEMACGKAVLALRIDAMPEIIDDHIDGLLVPLGNTQELIASILRLLDDPELNAKLGKAAREKVTAEFTWDKTAARLEEIYREVWH